MAAVPAPRVPAPPEERAAAAPTNPPPEAPAPVEPNGGARTAKVFANESTALAGVLRMYELAYNQLDAAAAAAIWPSVDSRALARAFARLRSQNLEFGDCTFAVSANDATAQCTGLLQYARSVGDAALRTESHVWTIEFVRAGEHWRISRMTAR